MKLRLLDLFCGAGGCSMGYSRAGFEVTGVDLKPQNRYPFKFIQGDAIEFVQNHGKDFDAIHASPPCQVHSRFRKLTLAQGTAKDHPDLIAQTRAALSDTMCPYVIENVEGAPLVFPVTLCGSMFGLKVQRHRIFECTFGLLVPQCTHSDYIQDKPPLHRLQGKSRVVGCYGNGRGKGDNVALWQEAMGITWMSRREMAQAIPPAYTEFIGHAMLKSLSWDHSDHHQKGQMALAGGA